MPRIHDLPRNKQAHRHILTALALLAGLTATVPAAARQDPFAVQKTDAMTFTHGRLPSTAPCGLPCTDFIVADGMIGLMSSFSYLIANKMLGEKSVPVLIDSPGGNLLGADSLAQMFRRLGVTVIVARARERACGPKTRQPCHPLDVAAGVRVFDVADRAECESACPFAVMGGTVRIVPPRARIGLHSPTLDEDSLVGGALLAIDPDARKTAAETDFEDLASIARPMGIDEAIVTRALKTTHAKMDYLSRADIQLYRLSTTSLPDAPIAPSLRRALSPPRPGSAGKAARG